MIYTCWVPLHLPAVVLLCHWNVLLYTGTSYMATSLICTRTVGRFLYNYKLYNSLCKSLSFSYMVASAAEMRILFSPYCVFLAAWHVRCTTVRGNVTFTCSSSSGGDLSVDFSPGLISLGLLSTVYPWQQTFTSIEQLDLNCREVQFHGWQSLVEELAYNSITTVQLIFNVIITIYGYVANWHIEHYVCVLHWVTTTVDYCEVIIIGNAYVPAGSQHKL